jgi:hypothetical protein
MKIKVLNSKGQNAKFKWRRQKGIKTMESSILITIKTIKLILISLLLIYFFVGTSFADSTTTKTNNESCEIYTKYQYIVMNYEAINGTSSDSIISNFMEQVVEKIVTYRQKEYLLFIEDLYRLGMDGGLSEELFSRFKQIYCASPKLVFDYLYEMRNRKDFLEEFLINSLIDEINLDDDPIGKKEWSYKFIENAIKPYENIKSKKVFYVEFFAKFKKKLALQKK